MTLPPLPHDDQPDTYSGDHTRTRVRWISIDVAQHLMHLCIHTSDDEPQQRRGTYCTRFNPQRLYDLGGMKLTLPGARGGYMIVPRRGLPIRKLFPGGHNLQLQGQPLQACPHCLTLAAVQAEMRGQRAYPVMTLCQQLERLPDQQHQA